MENYFEVQLFSGCNGSRELICSQLFNSVVLIAEKFSSKSDFSVEDELHYILSELVYKFLLRVNDYPIPFDKSNFNYAFSIFTNSFIDDDSDSHSTLEKISIFTKKDAEYNLGRVENYIEHYAGNCIDVLIQCVGLSAFLDLIRERKSELNSKQEQLISEYKAHQQKRLNELYAKDPHFINY